MDYAFMPHHCAESLDYLLSGYALEFFSCLFALHNPHTCQSHCAFTLGGKPEVSNNEPNTTKEPMPTMG
jgi:hypothetical protein